MNKYCALLVVVSLPLSARDFVLGGRLEGATHTSISIRMADGRAVDAALSAGMAVSYSAADQVEINEIFERRRAGGKRYGVISVVRQDALYE